MEVSVGLLVIETKVVVADDLPKLYFKLFLAFLTNWGKMKNETFYNFRHVLLVASHDHSKDNFMLFWCRAALSARLRPDYSSSFG